MIREGANTYKPFYPNMWTYVTVSPDWSTNMEAVGAEMEFPTFREISQLAVNFLTLMLL